MINIDTVGYIGGIFFAICAFPQALQSYKHGHSRGVSALMLLLWFLGEVLCSIYIIGKHGFDGPLLLNYFMNLVFVSVISYYKFFERGAK